MFNKSIMQLWLFQCAPYVYTVTITGNMITNITWLQVSRDYTCHMTTKEHKVPKSEQCKENVLRQSSQRKTCSGYAAKQSSFVKIQLKTKNLNFCFLQQVKGNKKGNGFVVFATAVILRHHWAPGVSSIVDSR